ncbi:outer membrane protein assembly factor BamE [Amaricoccus macauensis]|uniref:outer membrane protein assembly factor BamE n=1 Tax=Amaricoccus macauensis TaxID=57001 RepID=UPI003C7CAD40
MALSSLHRAILGLTIAGALSLGCAPTIRVHGYVPPESDIATVQPGVDNFESVSEKLGQPSSNGLLQDRAWYYVQSTVRNYTYNRPTVVDRTVLAVEFNENGVVSGLAKYGLEDGRIINLTARTTETGGRTLGVLEQLFGNLLNIDAEQFNQ